MVAQFPAAGDREEGVEGVSFLSVGLPVVAFLLPAIAWGERRPLGLIRGFRHSLFLVRKAPFDEAGLSPAMSSRI